MKISANQLAPQLTQSLLPCYLVTGDEPLIVQECLDEIRAAARKCGFESRDLFVHAAGFDWSDLASAGSNLSLFAERRIVELRLPTGKPGVQGSAAIAELAGDAGDDLLILVAAPKLDRQGQSAKWVKALESRGALVQVWPVGQRELPAWIGRRMQAAGLEPDREAVALVADRVEGNLLAAQQEIEKLRLLHGPGQIDVAAVEASVADSSRFDVYKLVDAAIGGDASRAVRILAGVRGDGTEVAIVMWALVREIRTLAALADDVAAGTDLGAAMKRAKVWSSRQALVRSCIGRHPRDSLRRLMKTARRGDAAAKGQLREDPWQIALTLVTSLALPDRIAA